MKGSSMEEIVLPIMGIALPMVLVPTILVLSQRKRKREMEHVERMKALELGLPAPGNESWAARVCIAIGAGVPIGAFFFAWLAGMDHSSGGQYYWEAAAPVGVTGILCGTFLSTRLLPSRSKSQRPAVDAHAKPAYDPDAYDVVSRRG
jgi:hypothetical protein